MFEKIGTVPVSANNGSSFSQYSFTDPASVTGKVYYRLNMVANGDAGAKFSNIINVSAKESNQLEISNLVNPFDSNISFVLTAPQNEAIEIMVKDITGRTIKVEKMQVFKGSNTVLLSSLNTFQKGSFIIQVKSASGLINKIIQKK
ncbi:MAG: T9SS type A sorting domain-containing protein [Chitinophagaceae bacterium]|nr:T9SS type A sorting domain-containing protein [Chitinophagaceae bacterium]